jgi:hypothetical protein
VERVQAELRDIFEPVQLSTTNEDDTPKDPKVLRVERRMETVLRGAARKYIL